MNGITRLLLALVAALAVAACGEEAVEEAVEEEPAEDPADDGATVDVADGPLGPHLVDEEGMTLYLFTQDEADETVCYDDCAESWPPLLTEGEPEASGEADEALLDVTTRDDGGEQVTYAGAPLYYWVADVEPGDIDGQGVNDVWYLVSPDGDAITEEPDEGEATDDAGGY